MIFFSLSEGRLFHVFDGFFCAIQRPFYTQHQRPRGKEWLQKRLQHALTLIAFFLYSASAWTLWKCAGISQILKPLKRAWEREEATQTSSFTQANKSPHPVINPVSNRKAPASSGEAKRFPSQLCISMWTSPSHEVPLRLAHHLGFLMTP